MNARKITWLGQVDDPCASIQATINVQQGALNQLNATKPALQAAILAASQAGDTASLAQYQAELGQLNAAIGKANAEIANAKALLAACKALKPGCTTPDGTPSPECPAGQVCVGGKCVTPGTPPVKPTEPCSATNPCPAGQTCVNGVCITPAATTSKKSSGLGLLVLGGVAAAGALFLGPAIFGKGGASGAMGKADAARAARMRLLENRRGRKSGYLENRHGRRKGY